VTDQKTNPPVKSCCSAAIVGLVKTSRRVPMVNADSESDRENSRFNQCSSFLTTFVLRQTRIATKRVPSVELFRKLETFRSSPDVFNKFDSLPLGSDHAES